VPKEDGSQRPTAVAAGRGAGGGTGCVKRARPGLWGDRWGNHRLYPEADALDSAPLMPELLD
jgi:hypothetical protein